ncbi:hypothetical protein Tco_0285804 [Tanacetum coccineum]
MDDPNITIEEYIRLEEEKAQRHGRTFNWQTTTFGKVKNNEDEDDHPIDFEIEFPAIVFENTLTAIQFEPTICPPNKNELDFRISLDESDDEVTRIRPLINSECIDEINLIDETSLSEYDEEIVSRFNDLFNDIHPDDLKSEKDDDDNDIDMAPLPAADQRHPWLRYQIEEYTKGIRHSYDRVEVGSVSEVEDGIFWLRTVGTCRMSDTIMDLDTIDTLCFQLGGVRIRMTWRQFILALVLHTKLEMVEVGLLGPCPSYVLIRDPVMRLCHRMIAYSIFGRGQTPEKVTGIDLFYLRNMDRGTINVPHPLAHGSRLMQLNELAELRDGAYENTRIYKERTKKWHDSRLHGDKDFKNSRMVKHEAEGILTQRLSQKQKCLSGDNPEFIFLLDEFVFPDTLYGVSNPSGYGV